MSSVDAAHLCSPVSSCVPAGGFFPDSLHLHPPSQPSSAVWVSLFSVEGWSPPRPLHLGWLCWLLDQQSVAGVTFWSFLGWFLRGLEFSTRVSGSTYSWDGPSRHPVMWTEEPMVPGEVMCGLSEDLAGPAELSAVRVTILGSQPGKSKNDGDSIPSFWLQQENPLPESRQPPKPCGIAFCGFF